MFNKMDSLMDKFEQDPSCFDEYINLLKPHSSYFKRVRQSIEEFNLANDEDIVALLEQTQSYAPSQVYTTQPQPQQVYANPYQSQQPQANPQAPNVSHMDAYQENQAYASGNHQIVYESVVSFNLNGDSVTFSKKSNKDESEEEEEEEEEEDDSDYVTDDNDDEEEEEKKEEEKEKEKRKKKERKKKKEGKTDLGKG